MHDLLGPMILFALVMSLTPGPNVIMTTASAANFGFARSVPLMLGVVAGFGLLAVAAGAGLAGLFAAEPRLHAVLKYAGGAYLLYLAWRIAGARPAKTGAGRARPIGFPQAALLQWVNPKGWVFVIGAFSAYRTAAGDPFAETLTIVLVNTAACGVSLLVWAGFGTAIGRLLGEGRPRRVFNLTMALLLVLSLVPVFA
jgi:threonine/homoserine/homoserine lactone efflux protein